MPCSMEENPGEHYYPVQTLKAKRYTSNIKEFQRNKKHYILRANWPF